MFLWDVSVLPTHPTQFRTNHSTQLGLELAAHSPERLNQEDYSHSTLVSTAHITPTSCHQADNMPDYAQILATLMLIPRLC